MITIEPGENLRVKITVKNVGTAKGKFSFTLAQIRNKSALPAGNFTLPSYADIEPGQEHMFIVTKTNWMNGLPGGAYHLEMFDCFYTVKCEETQALTNFSDLNAIQHFEGLPQAQISTRIYEVY